MSHPNRFSREFTVKQLGEIENRKNPYPYNKFIGTNVIGKAPALPEPTILAKRNEALAYMRNDERFKNINTMHPAKSNKFSETGKFKNKR